MKTAGAIAVFDAGTLPALAFVRSLASRGVPVTVFSPGRSEMARWSRYATDCRPCPEPTDRTVFLPWLKTQLTTRVIDRIAPTSDLMAFYCAELRDEFPHGIRRIIPTVETIAGCLDKKKLHERCTALELTTPHVEAPRSVDEAAQAAARIGYPLFIKPRTHIGVGMSERGRVVSNERELRDHFRRYPLAPGYSDESPAFPDLSLPLLQKFVPDADERTLCATGFFDAEHGVRAMMISERRMAWPPDVGVSVEQVSVANPRVESAATRLLAGLKVSGIFGIEMLVRGDEYLVNDLNPRGFGFMSFNHALGHDLPWMWYQVSIGVMPEVASRLPEGRRWIIGLPFHWRMAWALLLGPDRLGVLRRWFGMLKSSPATGIFRLDDPLPALFSVFGLLRHPRSFAWQAIRKQLHLRERHAVRKS